MNVVRSGTVDRLARLRTREDTIQEGVPGAWLELRARLDVDAQARNVTRGTQRPDGPIRQSRSVRIPRLYEIHKIPLHGRRDFLIVRRPRIHPVRRQIA